MGFNNIDAPGRAIDRRGVRAIQRAAGSSGRQSAAQARRDARRAKRANGPNVVILSKMPRGNPPGINQRDQDGAYVWGGTEATEGRYQIVVIGPLKASVDDYRAALARWLGKPVRLVEERPLGRPVPDDNPERQFLSLILEPA